MREQQGSPQLYKGAPSNGNEQQHIGCVRSHLHIIHAVLEGAIRIWAGSMFPEVGTKRHSGRVKLVQKTAIISTMAHVFEPVDAHSLQTTSSYSFPVSDDICRGQHRKG